jgi:hypothetical protein
MASPLQRVWKLSMGRMEERILHNLSTGECQCVMCGEQALIKDKTRANHVFCGKQCLRLLWEIDHAFSLGMAEGRRAGGEMPSTVLPGETISTLLLSAGRCGLGRSRLMGENEEGAIESDFIFKKQTVAQRGKLDLSMSDASRVITDRTSLPPNVSYLFVPALVVSYEFLTPLSFLREMEFRVVVKNAEEPLDRDLLKVVLPLQGEEIVMGAVEFLAFLSLVQEPYKCDSLPPYMDLFIKTLKTGELPLVARRLVAGWAYREAHFLICHLLYFPESRIIFLRALSMLDGYGINLKLTSIQDFVQIKLTQVSGEKTQPRITLGQTRNIRLGLPPFDDLTWPVLVDNYRQDDSEAFVPYSSHLKEKKWISIVARDDEGRLAGYVTCHMERSNFAKSKEPQVFPEDPNLEVFARKTRNGTLMQIFSIDGLHVSEAWRGGRGESLATLLMYHALELAVACGKDVGIDRVACESAARTTSLIMRQFGATFLRESEFRDWLTQRYTDKKDISEDVKYYAEQFPFEKEEDNDQFDANLSKSVEEAYDGLLWVWGRSDYKFDRLLKEMKSYSANIKSNDWDTFLSISPLNKVFHQNMEKYRRLVAELGTVKRERVEGMDVEESSKKKRTDIYFSESSLDAFMPFL